MSNNQTSRFNFNSKQMKKSLFLLLATVALGISQINAQTYVTIPDANFAGWLNNVYPACMNGNQLNIECATIPSITNINVQSYSIANLSGIEHFTALQFLNCSFNQLTSLPSLPSTLLNLNCLGNQLNSLPELPESLLALNCSGNPNLNTLPAYPPNLESLTMGGTAINLNNYAPLPETLITLSLQFGQHTSLPTLPPNLLTLMCGTNPLGSLPELPASLTNLACNNNELTSLPNPLPPNLVYLTCPGNNLTTIPELPSTLVSLFCENNQLTGLPNLPNGITTLIAHNNLLTSLPELPTALTYFECYNNELTQLPALPPLLNNFYCQNNQLTSFPEIPASMLILNASYNQITCWPTIPNMPSPNLTNNPFSCLPNYIPSMGVFGLLDYPLCEDGDLTNNPFGCESAKGVTGKIYADDNNDCEQNNGESGMANVPVKLFDAQGNFVSLTSSAGNGIYFLSADTLEYTVSVDVEDKPYQASCTDPGSETELSFTPAAQLIQGVDFGMECVPGFDIGVQSAVATGTIFPGQPHTLKVIAGDLSGWYGLACATGSQWHS
jgi:Leucine-rich repeat (LRR) protein